MFDSTVNTIRRRDFTTWSRQFADNAVLHAPNLEPLVGRAAILAWGPAFPPIDELTFYDVKVTGEDKLAYGTSSYVLKFQGAPADTGKQLIVFRRSDGNSWEIPAGGFSSNGSVSAQAMNAIRP